MPDILSLLSIAFLPLLITIILVWGIWKKVPIYDTFIKGAKDGLKTSVEILPFLLGIFLAIGALTSSGAMGFLQETTRPFFGVFITLFMYSRQVNVSNPMLANTLFLL